MDYLKIYNNLIFKAKTRTLDGYKEEHHIKPRCMGGTDDKENLVNLTPEEHYLAHLLLVKIYPKNHKLIFAANMMCVNSCDTKRQTNKRYGWLKRKLSHTISISNSGRPAWNKNRKMSSAEKELLQTKWCFIFPDGKEEVHFGLHDFCLKYNLNPSAMSAVCKGKRNQHKGFKCIKLTNIGPDDNKSYIPKPRKTTSDPVNRIKVCINGVHYKSVHLASKALNISRKKVEILNEY